MCYTVSGIQTFNTCLERLKAAYPEVVPYFTNHLDLHHEKWAAAFRQGVFTAGINSTQRGEGMNARVKATLKSKGRLMTVLGAIDDQLTNQKKTAETREAISKSTIASSCNDLATYCMYQPSSYLTLACHSQLTRLPCATICEL